MEHTICPTITAYDTHGYQQQMERLVKIGAKRIHIDLMDGVFAPTTSPGLDQIWWPEGMVADIHLMYQNPMATIDQLVPLHPDLVIIHQEAAVNHHEFAERVRYYNMKPGLALLPETPVEAALDSLLSFDHVLVFSGDLGRHGGRADLGLLEKVAEVHKQHPSAEIGWDGGVNDQNAAELLGGGVDVLNVGGFIHGAADPAEAYATLRNIS